MDLSEHPRGDFRRHPWELARLGFFRRVLAEGGALGASSVLDVGAGDAWFARELRPSLARDARVVCWDAGYTQGILDDLRANSQDGMQFTRDRPDARFGLVVLLDVLEHVEDDVGFLDALVAQNLAPGATVLVSVPASPLLFTAHDARLGHFRRYRPRACAALLARAGLRVERSGGLFHSLVVPRLATRVGELLRPRARPSHDGAPETLEWHGGPVVTRAVAWALGQDNRVSFAASRAGVNLPGLSWWALLRAP